MQYTTLTSLGTAVDALRRLNPCLAPWVFTAYCYLDFGGVYEMAASTARQARCHTHLRSNAAVYMASLLRNVAWTQWDACWGDAFHSAFGAFLQQSSAGHSLLASFRAPRGSIADEVDLWRRHGLDIYALQWQNFKSIGLTNTYSVENALGVAYPFTLQHSNGQFRLESQTTFKFYWSLANDFYSAMATNTSQSLLRASPTFRYANQSLEDVYLKNGTFLQSPLDAGFTAVRAFLGPFGTIDTKYVPVPRTVRLAARDVWTAVAAHRASSRSNQEAYAAINVSFLTSMVPVSWLDLGFYSGGGSLLCPASSLQSSSPISVGLQRLFLFERTCSGGSLAAMYVQIPKQVVFASLFAGLSPTTNLTSLYRQVPGADVDCEAMLRTTLAGTATLDRNATQMATVHATLLGLNIALMQYGMDSAALAPMTLYTSPLLDDEFRFFGYALIHDWICDWRDVVSFTGDTGTLTLLSDLVLRTVEPVQSAELCSAYALYAFAVVQYVTLAIASLAGLTGIYILASRGHIEGTLKLSRVGGIVWVGRPLLLVRSFTALCLLSTATLSLETTGFLTYFKSEVPPTLSTCLAASEVTWLAGIVNDIGLPLTQEHSARYVTLHSVLVLAIAASVSSLQPVADTAEMDLQCSSPALDYQVTCSTARIAIGLYDRLLFILGTVFVSNALAFGLVRVFWPVKTNDARRSKSFMLTAGAKFLFKHDEWFYHDVYYMDRASALLNGLVTLTVRSQLLLFDVKTWRLYAVRLEANDVPTRLASGVPLHDPSTASVRAIADCHAKHAQGIGHLRPLYP
ncbi:hypothetical protein SDRG_16766 [Saprolegnia diclina VS20]|uniref:Uncharacterized protein n=1 Tax=Saprolegnia diclina (strain VS20) TaxID=1156394 RepID=T0PSY7_SAPDV|nr:hypothetical protein SDRG_16766 [Saprolegnia diclina VS20]EQC25356.1 hypothetical protein SDRG_16766 [Saprolegnia diclina VS20]|eukprot:XP_008621206.1 hypothetical protein SDRG_16766 [Saprolegnia diclina VS20]